MKEIYSFYDEKEGIFEKLVDHLILTAIVENMVIRKYFATLNDKERKIANITALLHDIGKAKQEYQSKKKFGKISFKGHEITSARIYATLLNDIPEDEVLMYIGGILTVAKHHQAMRDQALKIFKIAKIEKPLTKKDKENMILTLEKIRETLNDNYIKEILDIVIDNLKDNITNKIIAAKRIYDKHFRNGKPDEVRSVYRYYYVYQQLLLFADNISAFMLRNKLVKNFAYPDQIYFLSSPSQIRMSGFRGYLLKYFMEVL